MANAITNDIRHIRGHDWHFAVTIPGHSRAAWVIAQDGPNSQQQLAFMAVAAAARAGNDSIEITFETFHETEGSAQIRGTTQVTLLPN